MWCVRFQTNLPSVWHKVSLQTSDADPDPGGKEALKIDRFIR